MDCGEVECGTGLAAAVSYELVARARFSQKKKGRFLSPLWRSKVPIKNLAFCGAFD
jgi:hypothetical protein